MMTWLMKLKAGDVLAIQPPEGVDNQMHLERNSCCVLRMYYYTCYWSILHTTELKLYWTSGFAFCRLKKHGNNGGGLANCYFWDHGRKDNRGTIIVRPSNQQSCDHDDYLPPHCPILFMCLLHLWTCRCTHFLSTCKTNAPNGHRVHHLWKPRLSFKDV